MPIWSTYILEKIKDIPGDILAESPFFKNANASTNVRKSGLDFKYTVEELDTLELLKHSTMELDQIETFMGLTLFEFQKETMTNLLSKRFNVVHTCRQAGVSTMLAALAVSKILSGKSVLVIQHNGVMNENFITKCKDLIFKIPFFLQPGVSAWNLRSINFDNMTITSKDSKSLSKMANLELWIKGFDLVIFEGVDYIPEFGQLFNRIMPIVSASTASMAISTLSGDKKGIVQKLVQDDSIWTYNRITGETAFTKERLDELRKMASDEEISAEFKMITSVDPKSIYRGSPEDIMNAPSPFHMMVNGGIEESDVQAYDRIMNDSRGIMEATGAVPPHIIMQNLEIIYKLLRK